VNLYQSKPSKRPSPLIANVLKIAHCLFFKKQFGYKTFGNYFQKFSKFNKIYIIETLLSKKFPNFCVQQMKFFVERLSMLTTQGF